MSADVWLMVRVPWLRVERALLVPRLALLPEGSHALAEVLAAAHAVAQLLLERLARAGVLGDRRADLLLDGLHGAGAVLRDALGDLERDGQHALGLDHLVDPPEARGLGGVDQAPSPQQAHGVAVADLLGDLDGGAAERIDRPLPLGQREPRVPPGHAQ